jgi:hypothetical protein
MTTQTPQTMQRWTLTTYQEGGHLARFEGARMVLLALGGLIERVVLTPDADDFWAVALTFQVPAEGLPRWRNIAERLLDTGIDWQPERE